MITKLFYGMMVFLNLISTAAANMTSPQLKTIDALNELATSYQKAFFDRHPELEIFWGKTGIQDKFMDRSHAGHLAWQQKEDQFLKALENLSEQHLINTAQYPTYRLLKHTLETNQAARLCKEELWHINPIFGWHNQLAMIAQKQRVGTPHAREEALTRWKTFPQVVEDEINNLKKGVKEGYLAPKPAVQRVLQQLNIILSTPLLESPYYEFANRDGNALFKKEVATLVEERINPALQKYIYYLEKEYYPLAREAIGVSALPGGEKCYHAKIRQATTLSLTPQAIHEYGLSHMQVLYQEVAEIGQRLFTTTDMVEIFALIKQTPAYFFHSEQDILNYNTQALQRAKNILPQWFEQMPKAEGVLKPYPFYRVKTGAPGEYYPPSEDGTRPGIFYINTFEPHKQSRAASEAILFHELLPGHHLQLSLGLENNSYHSLHKYLWNAGFAEGWALYIERLADQMGLYSDDISRLGMLSNEALRTARLVVDPAIHVMGWTRQQAVDYLKKHSALDDNIIESEVDRYMMLPGQATSYMLGKREIENLRQEAQAQLGDNFDIRQFHTQVLKNGAVTLPMLRDQISGVKSQQLTK